MVNPYYGQISMVAFDFAPRGFASCDGQILSIMENQVLYALLSDWYGGDGRTTFALPDFRGRVPIHRGQGPGIYHHYQIGDAGGVEEVHLASSQLPAHNHSHQIQLNTTIPAANTNADSIEPTPNTVLGIGNKPAGMAAEQIKNFSTNAPDTTIAGGVVSGNITLGDTGGGLAHNNMQPFLAVNFVIAMQGNFPPRN